MTSSSSKTNEKTTIDNLARWRQEVASEIYMLWTDGGSDISGLAGPMLDGRLVALGKLTTLEDFHQEDDDLMDQSSPSTDTIAYHDVENFSYQIFRNEFMIPNVPVMIRGLTKNWGANAWLREDDDGDEFVPDMRCLCKLFGSEVVPVQTQLNAGFTISRPTKLDVTMEEYAKWWELHHHHHHTDSDHHSHDASLLYYLKDWKFVATHPEINAYDWPIYFRDDWLNGAMGNAYKFIYLGPAGTTTRLHADVLRSFSWSTNICGRKRWFLIPPQNTYLLLDCFGRNLAPDIHTDITSGLHDLYPGLKYARKCAIEVFQEPGETIFVPSNWFHTVENLAPTLSINHNWLNAANIGYSWNKLRDELANLGLYEEHVKKDNVNGNANKNSSDTSQVDDLVLLWLVLSKKAKEILGREKNTNPLNTDDRCDLEIIVPILEEMRLFVETGYGHELNSRCECNIDELIGAIREKLE